MNEEPHNVEPGKSRTPSSSSLPDRDGGAAAPSQATGPLTGIKCLSSAHTTCTPVLQHVELHLFEGLQYFSTVMFSNRNVTDPPGDPIFRQGAKVTLQGLSLPRD